MIIDLKILFFYFALGYTTNCIYYDSKKQLCVINIKNDNQNVNFVENELDD